MDGRGNVRTINKMEAMAHPCVASMENGRAQLRCGLAKGGEVLYGGEKELGCFESLECGRFRPGAGAAQLEERRRRAGRSPSKRVRSLSAQNTSAGTLVASSRSPRRDRPGVAWRRRQPERLGWEAGVPACSSNSSAP